MARFRGFVNLFVLGPVQVAGDDGPIAHGMKQRCLLAALAVAGGKACSADALIDALWGERPPQSASKLLQVYVSQLRKTLPGSITITTSAAGYALSVDPDRFDAASFERLLADGRAALGHGNVVLAASLLDRAVRLWRGSAYEDFADEDFARGESHRLNELRLIALEERCEAKLRLGLHAELLAGLRSLVADYPLRERFHAQLMLALYRAGRQVEALEISRALYEHMVAELGVEPSLAVRQLEQQILRQDPALVAISASTGPIVRLPEPATALRGREHELADLEVLLSRADARMIVLAGAAGSGKTRLALETARRLVSSFANGAVFVELGQLRDTSVVIPAIARSLGVPESPERSPVESLAASIGSQELLLVLDSAEHVPGAWPSFVELLALAPRLKIIVTSRRVLHVSGEHVFPVPPLDDDASIALFVERARALDPSFDADGNMNDIRQICARLDGLPLAIELAAARTNTLSASELLQRLISRLTVLTSGPRDLPARQHTLRDTLAWSVALLGKRSQRDLGRLSVFAAPWTIADAESVVDADIDAIAELVDHNLVQRKDPSRFGMLDIVREFASELLDQSSDAEEVRRRHALHALEVAERAEAELGGPEQSAWFGRLEAIHDDVGLAQAWLFEAGETADALRLAAAIGRFRYVRGYLAEGRAALEEAIARGEGEAPALRAKACRVASAICVLQGDWTRARQLCADGLSLYESAGDLAGVARSLSNLGAILLGAGEADAAATTLDEAVRQARMLGDARVLALSLNNRGDVALSHRDWEGAQSLFSESLALLRALGDDANVARSLFNLAAATLECGRDDEAEQLLAESLDRCIRLDDKEDMAWCLIASASIAERRGAAERGAMLLGAAGRLLEGMGASMKPFERSLHERTARAISSALGPNEYADAIAKGRELEFSEVWRLARNIDSR